MSRWFDVLPPRWRQDRLVASDRQRLTGAQVLEVSDEVLVLAQARRRGAAVVGYGTGGAAASAVVSLVDAGLLGAPVDWLSLPRDVDLPEATAARLQVQALPGWDWWSTTTVPPVQGPQDRVERLTDADATLVVDCLAEANPGSEADPSGADGAGWWGVRDGDRLIGVIGAAVRASDDPQRSTWHLQGLGVRAEARGRGLGRALTSVATREGLAAGLPWVSLGMWADNVAASALYGSLGFRTDHQRRSYRPVSGRESARPV
ncbi:GNAT family N-acetyltransferase [Cellulomonas soli]|uniref:GNAT family N-acetyltransferase n=1 Tax=Cellulomonas soli TaxID=931535 RepID=UPI003F87F922